MKIYICDVCGNKFKKKITKRFISVCSRKCYLKLWRKNPDKRKKYIEGKNNRHSWKSDRYSSKKNFACLICGFNKALDFAHIKSIKDGGKETKSNLTILCPNHHRLYDKGLLTNEELEKIKPISEILRTLL